MLVGACWYPCPWFVVLVGRYAATLNAGEFVLAGDTCLLVRAGCGFLVFGYQKLL